MFDLDDLDDNEPTPRRYTFRCLGWAGDFGPCGDPDCSLCGPSVAVPDDENEDEDDDSADGEE